MNIFAFLWERYTLKGQEAFLLNFTAYLGLLDEINRKFAVLCIVRLLFCGFFRGRGGRISSDAFALVEDVMFVLSSHLIYVYELTTIPQDISEVVASAGGKYLTSVAILPLYYYPQQFNITTQLW